MTYRIGSLFSGYAGLDLAVQAVYDASVAWHVEFDAAPSRILAHHWPGVPNLKDVATVDWSTVEPVDILTGGFPCQDVSVAGRRAGMVAGTRSGLWAHMAHAIDVLRPQLVVIENVGGLFSAEAASVVESHPLCLGDGGTGSDTVLLRAIDAVLSTLSELGYDAEWTALRASDVGAPHGRLRVFITAHPQGEPWSIGDGDGRSTADTSGGGGGGRATLALAGDEGGAHAEAQRAGDRPDPSGGAAGLKVLPTPRAGAGMSSPLRPGAKDTTRLEDAVAVNLLPTPAVNDMGASYTPEQRDEWTARMKSEHGNGNGHGKSLSIEAQRLLPTPGANLGENGGPQHPDKRRAGGHSVSIEDAVHGLVDDLLPTPSVADTQGGRKTRSGDRSDELLLNGLAAAEAFGPYAPAIERWERVIGRPAPPATEPGKTRPRLSARFVEWMMGLPDGHVTGVGLTRNQGLKALGNGVVVQQGAAALVHLDQIRRTS